MTQGLHGAVDSGVADLAIGLRSGQFSAEELARALLDRIGASPLNAFLDLRPEVTLAQARAADARIARGEARALEGVPIAHKDVLVTRDWVSTAGSRMLADYRSPFDATVVDRLFKAGMVGLGKLNCDEFAMGSTNENSAFGSVRNPWDLGAVPGGSSGGSAAAVAAGLTPAATGTDTGGSIRQPAAFCGITGIKPTYGRASRYGLIAYASSLDQAGPMARSAKDCALLLSAMCGFDPMDATSLDLAAEDFTAGLDHAFAPNANTDSYPLSGLRIGLPDEFFGAGVASDVTASVRAALDTLETLGAQCVRVQLPNTELAIPAYYVIAPAEASSNLSRFDGVRYGHRTANPSDLRDLYRRSRAEGFGAEVKRRILVGAYVLSHGYYDAYYLRAQKVRRLVANDFDRAFEQCDLIAGPVAPTVAWNLGAHQSDPLADYLADIFTLPASLAGLPGLSMPVGFGSGDGSGSGSGSGSSLRPVGLQLIGPALQEARLLRVAHQFQQVTDWHLRRPPEPRSLTPGRNRWPPTGKS
jgi:aspartyl-tRNA(Asn)/glutamyl-tRNA(Gln) amidotransferase subunit A